MPSSVGSKAKVHRGSAHRTIGGMTKTDILLRHDGRYVSKKKHVIGKANAWIKSVQRARRDLGVSGFEAVKKGTALYERAMAYYTAARSRSRSRSHSRAHSRSHSRAHSRSHSRAHSRSHSRSSRRRR